MSELMKKDENSGSGNSSLENNDLEKDSLQDSGFVPSRPEAETRTAGKITGIKRGLALVLAASMILIAAATARLAMLWATTEALDIDWEDWLERRSYRESTTLATHAHTDLYSILEYIQLKQALEEPDGSLDLDRPVLAAVLMDNSIAVYTMRDMMEMGEMMGIYVYEGMTEQSGAAVMDLGDEEVLMKKILWSVFDYESGNLNPDTFSFRYGEENPWDIRLSQINNAIAEAEAAIAADPDVYTAPPEYERQESQGQQASQDQTPGLTEGENVSYIVVSQDQAALSEYCYCFLIQHLQNYYIWKEQFSAQESSLHWELCLEKDGQILRYGDPAALSGETDKEQLDVCCRYDSETKAVSSTFTDRVDLMAGVSIKGYQIHEYDECTFYMGLQTDRLQDGQDTYSEEAYSYNQCKKQVFSSIILMGVSLLMFAVAFIWLTVLSGRRDGDREIVLNAYDRLPTELGLAGICLLVVLGIFDGAVAVDALETIYYNGESSLYYWIFLASLAGLVVLGSLLLWLGWYGLVRRIKAHTIWQNSLIRYCLLAAVRLIRRIGRGIANLARSIVDILARAGDRWWKTLGLYGMWLTVNLLLWTVTLTSYNDELWFILMMLAFNGAAAYLLLRKMNQRKQVRNGIDRIASGDIDYQLPLQGLQGESYSMAVAINSVSDGLKNAVEEKVKNERMRAELITNVSHDIKTPLTSIINYVDLLKRENIDNPKVQEYLNILEKKAERLRVLTEDLVEASKASSGVLKLNQEEIDFVELVNQTNGEFSDRFAQCNLRLICSIPEEPVYILADGRYVWRILENLYRNVEKYALPGTRVYVEVAKKGNRICFVIKNISATELNIRAEELTERFIRGDASRTTEGSGLGLSIARDLTRLMNGTFQIYLDGDLFRVTVSFLVHE